MKPPFIPKAKKPLKLQAYTTTEEEKVRKEKEEEGILLKRNSVQNLFNGYHYDIELEYKDLIEKELESKKLKENMDRIIRAKVREVGTPIETTMRTDETLGLLKQS